MDRHINFLLVRSPFPYYDILNSKSRNNFRYLTAFKMPISPDMARNRRSNIRITNGNNNRLHRLKKCMSGKYNNVSIDHPNIYIPNCSWWVWNSKLPFMLYLGVLRWYCEHSLHANAWVRVWKFCWSLWGLHFSIGNSCFCISNYSSKNSWFQNWR